MDPSAALRRMWPGGRATAEPLSGGIPNHNCKVEVEGRACVLRMGGADTPLLGIDRQNEHEASVRAAEVGVGPAVAGFVEPEGWLVTRFIDGRPIPVEDMQRPETIGRVASALRRFHEAAPIPGRFDAHEVVEEYRREA